MRILVITGSRALDCDARPRRWALRQFIDAFARHTPEIVVHGDAIGPDTWADELAAWAGIPRVAWPVGARSPTTRLSNGTRRPLKDAGAYPYSDPLSRNEAMIRWAANQAVSDHPGVRSPNGEVRPVKDVGAYPYGDPLSRNEAMIRWAANMAVSDAPAVRGPGHVVQVFGLLAPWSSTHGTAGTLLHARNMDLAVESISAPSEAWPEEDTAHGGQGA